MRVLRISGVLIGVMALCYTIYAQVSQPGIWVPGYNEQMPRYWTGTLNLARGAAVSNGGWIQKAEIYIWGAGSSAGTPLKSWENDVEGWGPMGKSLEVTFDSTHFSDGQVVFVKYRALDMQLFGFWPVWLEASGFVVAHNKSYTYEHHDADDWPNSHGAARADTALSGMNYVNHTRHSSGWTSQTVQNDSYDAAVLYFNTHGGSSEIAMDDNTLLSTGIVEPLRNQINGTGNQPFNSTGLPYTTYVHIDACTAGINSTFGKWFHPYVNAYFPSGLGGVVDQAVFGYSDLTYWGDRENMADLYWSYLNAGNTVGAMRNHLVAFCKKYEDITGSIYIRIGVEQGRSIGSIADCPVYGDPHTRIKTVYTGDSGAPVGWYR